jgi:hypothetical protein
MMQNEQNGKESREASLVKLYMELTGASESAGRGVFMYLGCGAGEKNSVEVEHGSNGLQTERTDKKPRIERAGE